MITEGYLARPYQGRSGGRDPALLDVAQDYALKVLHDEGVFDLGLTFKGGTALRKYGQGTSVGSPPTSTSPRSIRSSERLFSAYLMGSSSTMSDSKSRRSRPNGEPTFRCQPRSEIPRSMPA